MEFPGHQRGLFDPFGTLMYAKNLEGTMRFSATSITTEPVLTEAQCGEMIHQYGSVERKWRGSKAKVNKSIRKDSRQGN